MIINEMSPAPPEEGILSFLAFLPAKQSLRAVDMAGPATNVAARRRYVGGFTSRKKKLRKINEKRH